MSDDALSFLESVGFYTEQKNAPDASEDRPVRLGVVDGSYTGSGGARVTFDGESTMGTRLYLALATIAAGDRVVLLPIGHTYVILGSVGAARPGPFAVASGSFTTPSSIANGTSQSNSVVFPAGRFTVAPNVFVSSDIAALTGATNTVTASGCNVVTGNYSGTVVPTGRIVRWYAVQMTATSAAG